MSNKAITVQHLTKTFKNRKALDDVSLTCERGKIYGLVGSNGSGKTTLLRVLMGLVRPTAGRIELLGQQTEKGLSEARSKIGSLIETPVYHSFMRSDQNLKAELIAKGLSKNRKADAERINNALGALQLTQSQTGKILMRNYSLGMKQRYAIAAAIIGEPELLVLDEPVNGFDPEGIIELRKLLTEINKNRNTTILLSSHLLGELWQLATDYIFIHEGHILEQVTAGEVAARLEQSDYGDNLEAYYMNIIHHEGGVGTL